MVLLPCSDCICTLPPPPPPPGCGCPDLCSYIISVVSPGVIASSSPPSSECQSMDGVGAARRNYPSDPLPAVTLPDGLGYLPDKNPDWPQDPPNQNYARSETWVYTSRGTGSFGFIRAEVDVLYTVAQGAGGGTGDSIARVRAAVNLEIRCVRNPGNTPSYSVELNIGYLIYQSNIYSDGTVNLAQGGKRLSRTISTGVQCSSAVPRWLCLWGGDPTTNIREYGFLSTPLSFVASWDETNLGAWDYASEGVQTPSPPDDIYIELKDRILDSLSAGFLLTQRQSCRIVSCNCNAPLGGMYVTFGNLKSKYHGVPREFLVNSSTIDFEREITYLVSWQGPFGFYEYEEYDEDGPQDENGNRTQAMWRQRAELYCDIVDGVNQWYVLFTSFCFKYDEGGTYTHQSYDQWVGKIACYEACADEENYIDAGEPVPMGEPYDIEYLGRTTVAGYSECEPPGRATIKFEQIVTC